MALRQEYDHSPLMPLFTDDSDDIAVKEAREQHDDAPQVTAPLPPTVREKDFPGFVSGLGNVFDKQDTYTFHLKKEDALSPSPSIFPTSLEAISDAEGIDTPLPAFESSPQVEISLTPYDDPRLNWQIDGDLGTKIAEFNSELLNETSRALDENKHLSPVARDAIRGCVPKLLRPSLSPEPSETDITDNGNHLHNLKSQGQILPSIDQIQLDETLQDRLIDSLKDTPGYPERKGFFPRDMLASLIDVECVFRELKFCFQIHLDDNTILNYARRICGICSDKLDEASPPPIFQKIFVSLVLSEKTSTILRFLAEKVTDDDLPLSKVYPPGKSSGVFTLGRRTAPKVPLVCFKGWSAVTVRYFEEWQWSTISPFFARSYKSKTVNHFVLQDQAQLPFLSDSRREADDYERLEYDGGFSQVFKVDIHSAHHDFHDPKVDNRCFAVKCLLSRDRVDFDREVGMLKKFSGNLHPHLVSLLATYEQFNRFYLIFHWATADLQVYWEEINPNPSVDHRTTMWMAQQCQGIADGLAWIHHYDSSSSKAHLALSPKSKIREGKTLELPKSHNLGNSMEPIYGRHGDIKPPNVLLFQNSTEPGHMGTLKLTDFGLAEFNTLRSKSGKPKTRLATSPNYRPPECDLHDGTIGPSYDIWTLGCLYLEFITWLLGGWRLLKGFTNDRTSYDPIWHFPMDTFFEIVACKATGTPGAMIKPAVTKLIGNLHADDNCNDYLHGFLNLVEFDMMIVKPNNKSLRGRITCSEVAKGLRAMFKECVEHPEHVLRQAPWPTEHVPPLKEAVEADIPEPVVEELLKQGLRVHNGVTQRRMSSLVLSPSTVESIVRG